MNSIFFEMDCRETRGIPIGSEFGFEDGIRRWMPERPAGNLLVRTAGDYKKWPDMMYCGGDVVSFVISERIVDDLRSNNVRFDYGPVTLQCQISPLTPPPRFFYLCLPSGVELDTQREKSGLRISTKPDTWTGADLCVTADRRKLVYCSYRIIEIARERKWTNVQFTLAPGIAIDLENSVRKLDHLVAKKDWPPQWLKELLC